MLTNLQISSISWTKGDGLIPAIVQCAASARVLMLGYLNPEALTHTLASGNVTFFSRSKNRLWTKGESSGHLLKLVEAFLDCDHDTLLFLATPLGPTCHNGTVTCFDGEFASNQIVANGISDNDTTTNVVSENAVSAKVVSVKVMSGIPASAGPKISFLSDLDALIAWRKIELPANSYTTKLFQGELRRIAQKVGEEGVETALAAVAQDDRALIGEAADLVFHLLVLLRARGLGLDDVLNTLAQRHR
jgi:phosphoribosyl-AMP cyclohydrolase / phosphoribosyl-ATP pyrophosphohydrolase